MRRAMDTKDLAKVYKALSNENRLAIFKEILSHDQKEYEDHHCLVCQITDKLKIGAPTISHHLKELSNANLIRTRKEGKYLIASANRELLKELGNIFER